ncbi:MAG: DNA mismatch repair endonuclease MutL [Candidatus Nanoarchaeia archaeon]|nr:DNA mismatch repair endonuclease MutL [Candidatus Nanoarchaeia archaeon]
MQIQLLTEELINKIAAGEVIERPASVVKELLENSIDAGASFIDIEIKGYGKELIKVSDNGSGMSREDAKLAIVRHATSKISSVNDLFSIATLGFRGEALASIAAVSRTIITTRTKDSVEGFSIEVEGGKLVSEKTAGCPEGTTVEVHNLFFNTPARMKFLKPDAIELKSIADIVTRYALIYTHIAFRLAHNGHSLLSTAASTDMINNITSVYGKDTAKQMLSINFKNTVAQVSGYVSKPSTLKNERNYQSFYVNGRYVKDEVITQALYDAYHTLLFVNKHPVAVLSINLNPSFVDVNVHPTKDRIKFSNPIKVYESVFEAIRETLRNNSLVTDYSVREENVPMSRFGSAPSYPAHAPAYSSSQNILQTNAFQQNALQNSELQKAAVIQSIPLFQSKEVQNTIANELVNPHEKVTLSKLPAMRILGQIAKTYFLAEADDGFLLIDQHVVQERALYEKFMEQFSSSNVAKQQLVTPLVLEMSPADNAVVIGKMAELSSLGFEVEQFGNNSFLLRTVPAVFGRVQAKDLFYEVLEEISESRKDSISALTESIITRMACRASIKGGDECSVPEIIALLKELDKCKSPWTCPHGRPIIIKFSKDEIEKMFRRKG